MKTTTKNRKRNINETFPLNNEQKIQLHSFLICYCNNITRLREFLFNLECMNWLTWEDRLKLYNSNICTVAILKVKKFN